MPSLVVEPLARQAAGDDEYYAALANVLRR